MKPVTVSKRLMGRLPIYLSYLKAQPDTVENVSATVMANALHLGDVQVRKDLAKVAQAGRRRTGRNRKELIQEIEIFLEKTAKNGTIVVGTGKLGQALLDYEGFEESGLNVMAGFDSSPSAERTEQGKPIYHLNQLEAFCKCYEVNVGILAVPDDNTQIVCDRLVACGVRAIWNFTREKLSVPDYVLVQNENLSASLASLKVQLNHMRFAQIKEIS